jgi:hypothetical protein
MEFSASYSFEVNDNGGLVISPYVAIDNNESIWQNIDIEWSLF